MYYVISHLMIFWRHVSYITRPLEPLKSSADAKFGPTPDDSWSLDKFEQFCYISTRAEDQEMDKFFFYLMFSLVPIC